MEDAAEVAVASAVSSALESDLTNEEDGVSATTRKENEKQVSGRMGMEKGSAVH